LWLVNHDCGNRVERPPPTPSTRGGLKVAFANIVEI